LGLHFQLFMVEERKAETTPRFTKVLHSVKGNEDKLYFDLLYLLNLAEYQAMHLSEIKSSCIFW
jgi:hypothetical protein